MSAVASLSMRLKPLLPGLVLSGLLAVAAWFVAAQYGAPAMLLALLFGLALNFLGEERSAAAPGLAFAGRSVLRLGVALLGLRITTDMVAALGAGTLALVVGGVLATLGFGLMVSRVAGVTSRFAVLSAGAVAICGASAAMAIAAALPQGGRHRQELAFTVVGVTLLSTVAMVLYPVLARVLQFDDHTAGVYLGATIHDVAQVVGAGFSVSPEAGETATLVKLIRVAMLAPVVLVVAAVTRRHAEAGAARPPILPGFVLAFVALAAVNSSGLVPAEVSDLAGALSRGCLLMAIAAVGLTTSLRDVMRIGPAAMAMLLAETLFLAGFIALGLTLLG